MTPTHEAAPRAPAGKPRLSYFLATSAGVGYLPAAPGTWGSLVGILIYSISGAPAQRAYGVSFHAAYPLVASRSFIGLALAVVLALVGVVVSGRVARFAGRKDPQFVVIDEVSGQFLTYLLALAPLNWKYLLLGFILFRGFDTWKPFPARQAEAWPGGWGIMADDWMAGIYAALGLWLARALGL